MFRLIIVIVFALFMIVPFASYADECSFLAQRFADNRESMNVTKIAKLNMCISDYLSVRISVTNNQYGENYPPPTVDPPPDQLKQEIAPEEYTYLVQSFANNRESMNVTEIAKLNTCISDYLSVRVSVTSNQYGKSYPPPNAGQ